MTKKEEWLAGTRSAVPIMLGYVPVGIAYGVMARQAGLNLSLIHISCGKSRS